LFPVPAIVVAAATTTTTTPVVVVRSAVVPLVVRALALALKLAWPWHLLKDKNKEQSVSELKKRRDRSVRGT
jgi:hypothetical protein